MGDKDLAARFPAALTDAAALLAADPREPA